MPGGLGKDLNEVVTDAVAVASDVLAVDGKPAALVSSGDVKKKAVASAYFPIFNLVKSVYSLHDSG